MENVHRRATKIVRGLRILEYEERLRILELPTLGRMRGDMILTYRLIHVEEGIDYEKFFKLDQRHYGLRDILRTYRTSGPTFTPKSKCI